jgi:folylpolyglutamate synthase/dihydropteroate synthase
VVLTRPVGARGREPGELAALTTGTETIVEPRLGPALDQALAGSCPLLVICGSFYLVGEARQLLHRRFGVPAPAASIASC